MADLKVRCSWSGTDPIHVKYHDEEWGRLITDDKKMFEFLILESFQAGLSWMTILKKRENFRKAFDHFDYHKIANYKEAKISELLNDSGIIRNKLKVNAAVNNAQKFIELQNEFGSFFEYLMTFTQGRTIVNHPDDSSQIPATSELSDKISKDLKKRGFKFLGSIVIYSHLQATGIIDDHLDSCFAKKECEEERARIAIDA